MRGTTSLSCARSIGKQFRSVRSEWGGIVPSLEPRKHGNEDTVKESNKLANVKPTEPIVAFSRPPPLTPFLGPFVVVSLLDSWSRRDDED